MLDDPADKGFPIIIIFGRGYIALIMKNDVGAGGKRQRHKGQLHEGAHADGTKKIKDLVGVKKGIDILIIHVNHGAHIIR